LKKQLESHCANGNGALNHSKISTPKDSRIGVKRKLSNDEDEDVIDSPCSFTSSVFSMSHLSANSTILPPSPDDPDSGLRNGALKASLTQRLNAATAKTLLLG
jgi:hypothetical protein